MDILKITLFQELYISNKKDYCNVNREFKRKIRSVINFITEREIETEIERRGREGRKLNKINE